MDIVGNRKYVEIPGDKRHQLPPLLIHADPREMPLDRVMGMAADLVDSEDLIANSALELEIERRRMDLALNLVEQYLGLVSHWNWGDSILEWIRQCEITFESRQELRNLLHPDVWPHAGRSSFVGLLTDKAAPGPGLDLERAVGFRLTFRQPPPISCFSDQFLLYLKSALAETAYRTWVKMTPDPVSSLPPERFAFEILKM